MPSVVHCVLHLLISKIQIYIVAYLHPAICESKFCCFESPEIADFRAPRAAFPTVSSKPPRATLAPAKTARMFEKATVFHGGNLKLSQMVWVMCSIDWFSYFWEGAFFGDHYGQMMSVGFLAMVAPICHPSEALSASNFGDPQERKAPPKRKYTVKIKIYHSNLMGFKVLRDIFACSSHERAKTLDFRPSNYPQV